MAVIKYKNPNYTSEGTEPKYISIPNIFNPIEEVFIGDTQPEGTGKLWIDTTDSSIKYNNSGEWIVISSNVDLSNYITTETLTQSLASKVDTTLIPTNVSQLTNDSGYLTDAPSDGNQYGRKDGSWAVIEANSEHTLDLSPLFDIDGDPASTVTDEFLAELKKAYKEKYSVALADGANTPLNIAYAEGTYTLAVEAFAGNSNNYAKYLHQFKISETDKSVQFSTSFVNLTYEGAGTKALTDSGQYVDFAKPTKVENGGSGTVTKQINPNTFYKFGSCSKLTITLGAETSGIVNEYMFEFISGTTATTLSVPNSVKWSGGNAPTIEANKTYQVSIVDNLAVYAAF